MKLLAALPLLVACASTQVPAPTVKSAPSWPQELRDRVTLQCEMQFPEAYCACLVPALEAASPDPEAEFTREEIRAAVKVCGPIPKPIAETETL